MNLAPTSASSPRPTWPVALTSAALALSAVTLGAAGVDRLATAMRSVIAARDAIPYGMPARDAVEARYRELGRERTTSELGGEVDARGACVCSEVAVELAAIASAAALTEVR